MILGVRVLVKTVTESLFELVGLGDELGDHGHQRCDGCAQGVRDDGWRFELVGSQGGLDFDGAFVDSPLAATPAQRGRDLRA